MIIHNVYPYLIIRLGDEAVEIRRNTLGGKIENNRKTTVPNTLRTISTKAPSVYEGQRATSADETLSLRRISMSDTETSASDEEPKSEGDYNEL